MREFKKDEIYVCNGAANEMSMAVVDTRNIKKIIIKAPISKIGAKTFVGYKNLVEVEIADSVEVIEANAFRECINLERVDLGRGVRVIGSSVFNNCLNLRQVKLSHDLESIGVEAFRGCLNFSGFTFYEDEGREERKGQFILPKNVAGIDARAFFNCPSLGKPVFGERLDYVGANVFDFPVTFPDTMRFIDYEYIYRREYRDWLLPDGTSSARQEWCALREDRPVVGPNTRLTHRRNVLPVDDIVYFDDINVFMDSKGEIYLWNVTYPYSADNARVCIPEESTKPKYKKCSLTGQEMVRLIGKSCEYDNLPFGRKVELLEPWVGAKFLPNRAVVEASLDDDGKWFFHNNNVKNWAIVMKAGQSLTEKLAQDWRYAGEAELDGVMRGEDIRKLYLCARALGLFSPVGKESDMARDYILNEIFENWYCDAGSIAEGLPDFRPDVAYNRDFARFFMLWYKDDIEFLVNEEDYSGAFDDIDEEEDIEYVSYVGECQLRFEEIKEVFHNKMIITRHDNDRLTPELVMNYLLDRELSIIDPKCEFLGILAQKYNISNKDFYKMQKVYLEACQIKQEDMVLKCDKDSKLKEEAGESENFVTYELLDKNNAMGPLVGYETNCCQRIEDRGEPCLRYGMIEKNSGFLVFRNHGELIGQAWVWYDKPTGKICLDNIEVPLIHMDKLKHDRDLRAQCVECINRATLGFVSAMGEEEVSSVTIGKGANDFASILDDKYKKIDMHNNAGLTGYDGYSDAKDKQYVVYSEGQIRELGQEQQEKMV